MTLPFSDKPEKSSIYQDVKTETLQELTADQFDAFRARMFAEGVNGLEDEYRRLLLLGLAADKLSVSGPIPNTQLMIELDVSTATYHDIHEAGPGEVWQFVAGCANSTTGIVGTVTTEVDISSTGAGGERLLFIDAGSSSSSDFPLSEITQSPIVYSYGQKLRMRLEGTFTSAVRTFSVVRLR